MLLQREVNGMAKKQTNGNLALEQQRVIVIPAHDEIVARKLRVAAYARVSSSSEDQLNSYRVLQYSLIPTQVHLQDLLPDRSTYL